VKRIRIYTWVCPYMAPIDNHAQTRFFESFVYAELEGGLMPLRCCQTHVLYITRREYIHAADVSELKRPGDNR